MKKEEMKNLIIFAAAIALAVIVSLAPISGLEPLGRIYLGLVLCMLVLWLTEAVESAVTTFVMLGLSTLLLNMVGGMAYADAFKASMSSLATNSTALLMSAFFIVGAVNQSGLARRIALFILNVVGPKPKRFLAGILFCGAFLNMFIPAAMSVSALLTGIVGGIVADYKLDMKSNLSKSIYLCVGVGTIAGNIFCLTAGAPAVAVTGLISQNFGISISYFEYMKYGLPVALIMDIIAFIMITRLFPSEYEELPGGKEGLEKRFKELGPWSREEKTVGIVLGLTILMWMTAGHIHNIAAQTVAVLAVLTFFVPGIGCYKFKDLNAKVPWGTIIFCALAMSMAGGMVSNGTAAWLINKLVEITHVTSAPLVVILVVTILIMIMMSLLFSVRASAVTTLVPCVVLLGQAIAEKISGFSIMGYTMMMYYPILFAVILPVHTPYTLIPNAAGGYESKDLMKVQVPTVLLTAAACVILYFTYWKMVGLT